jgi:hypothetical protein
VLLALTSAGCSLKFVKPPPPHSEWPDPVTSDSSQERCTDGVALPIADTLAAVGFGTIGYFERHSDATSRVIAIGLDVTAIPFLVSAIYGYVGTERCHRYDKLFDQPQPQPQPLATTPTNLPPALTTAPPPRNQ